MIRSIPQILCLSLLAGLNSVLAAAAPTAAVLEAQQQRVEVVQRASAAAVAIFDSKGQGGGSGVVISPDGYALTNFHVTAPCGTAMKCGMADGEVYDAVIVGIDPVGDVALIQLLGRDDFPHAEMGDSNQVRVGDWAYAIGNPFLLADDFTPSVSYGIVSGVHRYQYPAGTLLEYTDCIQTDAAINPGNSGGPLFNVKGEVIGINGRGSFEKRGRVNVGVGYAISINQIKRFLSHLKSGRIVDHASLGATVSTQEDGRVVVDDILETSDVFRRGLRYGDEIIRFAGREISSANALKNLLGVFPRGWIVPLSYRRDGETIDVRVRLMGLHDQAQLFDLVQQEAQKPIEPPDGKKPDPEDQEEPKPDLSKHLKKKTELPSDVAARFEARRGYANYWYNLEKQRELWNHYRAEDLDNAGYDWELTGSQSDGSRFQIVTSKERAMIYVAEGNSGAVFSESLDSQLSPPGSGGLLLTLHIWQRLLEKGLRQFGEVYYLGQLPSGPNAKLANCLVGLYAGIETRFLFDPASGELVGIEMTPDDEHDPCELCFADYGEIDGQRMARHWEVYHGGTKYKELYIESAKGVGSLFSIEPDIAGTTSKNSIGKKVPDTFFARDALNKVVKIFGAGGLHEMEAHQSGILISPQGHVLTALSYVLDTDDVTVILDDGRKWQAEFIGSDPLLEIAVLKLPVDDEQLPHFDLQQERDVAVGQRVLALSNLFGIATGDEPVSVLQGVVTAVAPLAARRGAFHTNYQGQVYVVDAYANNPGAAGGALVDWEGRLLGILGKELRSEVTGTWLNYALPTQALKGPVDDIISGRQRRKADSQALQPEQPLSAEVLGVRLIPNILARTPPYIDSVRKSSAADEAGLRPDDLIVFLQQEPVVSCQDVLDRLAMFDREEELRISVLRDGGLLELTLQINSSLLGVEDNQDSQLEQP